MQADITLKGVVESDETFFRVSFKGQKNENFKVARESRYRGHSNSARGLSKGQACVLCAVNHAGMSIGKIANLGKPCVRDLENVLNGIIEQGSILVTDSFRAYQKIVYENELTHIRIPKGKHINGAFNIQIIFKL